MIHIQHMQCSSPPSAKKGVDVGGVNWKCVRSEASTFEHMDPEERSSLHQRSERLLRGIFAVPYELTPEVCLFDPSLQFLADIRRDLVLESQLGLLSALCATR